MRSAGSPAPRAVRVQAPAKINLRLGVGPVRDDGYHPLGTVYFALDWRDAVTARLAEPGEEWSVEVTTSVPERVDLSGVPTDADNLAVRAAQLVAARSRVPASAVPPVALSIDKQIPVAGGLAGGSADAAATLVACNHLWDLGMPALELSALAAELGSDVPFALLGETALGEGHGEQVTMMIATGEFWWVVLADPVGLSTPAVYAAFDTLVADGYFTPVGTEVPDGLAAALHDGDAAALAPYLANDLTIPAISLRPELAERLAAGAAAGALAPLLSGSGPTCLFLCGSRAHAEAVVRVLADRGLPGALVCSGPTPGALDSVEELA
ncbi:4-(cytidine 5'-diphospho)-2-C-methyl-D-erythritol kinase [Nocardioides massiliensis]|uniref:4-diphosphocytidyl-2-C-methyl-D-erythritol kinase n=1 Tax=Nocardioides massiliensis TaxID=1325935 RepID=A0ABT9NIM4_9ACTN|nr:4-(cytidine 5'-diphospho)-2-C-methyl-D-erythritol kinase [Nocardioides massiliensis]MDP9820267.1 4-diphosphocytidyl-2-C-methyl-D-erythritol kinase [Nocardioides massiliensis]